VPMNWPAKETRMIVLSSPPKAAAAPPAASEPPKAPSTTSTRSMIVQRGAIAGREGNRPGRWPALVAWAGHDVRRRILVEIDIGIGKSGRQAYGFDDIA